MLLIYTQAGLILLFANAILQGRKPTEGKGFAWEGGSPHKVPPAPLHYQQLQVPTTVPPAPHTLLWLSHDGHQRRTHTPELGSSTVQDPPSDTRGGVGYVCRSPFLWQRTRKSLTSCMPQFPYCLLALP